MDENRTEFINHFIEFEAKNRLFDREIAGIKYWHLIRCDVCWGLESRKYHGICTNFMRKNIIPKYDILTMLSARTFHNIEILGKKDIVIFNHQRRMKQGRAYVCVYTDEWLKQIKRSYYVIEYPYEGIHYKPAVTRHLKYFDLYKYMTVHGNNGLNKSNISVREEAVYLFHLFENEFDLTFSLQTKNIICGRLYDYLNKRELYISSYKHLLKKISPKALVLVVSYDTERMFLIEAAKELNIPTIELQHGCIGDAHMAYNFHEKMSLKTFPDYIFTYGKYDVEVPRYPIAASHIIPVGSPQLEREANRKYKKTGKKNSRMIITFISSSSPKLCTVAADLSKKINQKQYEVRVRLHPSENSIWKQIYPDLINAPLKVINQTASSLYECLAESEYVIGDYSTALFEATAFNCQILIMPTRGFFNNHVLVERGRARAVYSVNDILKALHNKIQIKNDDYFFSSNSKELIYKAIEKVISECKQ